MNFTFANVPGFWRGYQGFELSARKRMSNNWMMATSFSFNDTKAHADSPAGYPGFTDALSGNNTFANVNSDPTNMETSLNGGQYAPESTLSGLGNVFVNARWIFRVNGAYTLPWWDIQVAANYNSRSGYPYVRSVLSPGGRSARARRWSTWTSAATCGCRRSARWISGWTSRSPPLAA